MVKWGTGESAAGGGEVEKGRSEEVEEGLLESG